MNYHRMCKHPDKQVITRMMIYITFDKNLGVDVIMPVR